MIVSKVIVERFRGIPGHLTLDLKAESSDRPQSLILVGDNGTGKSSIVDAMEFALQAHIGRDDKNKALCLATDGLPHVQVHFADDSMIERGLINENGKVKLTSESPHLDFAIASFILRRSDLRRFIDTPESQRLTIFNYYLKGAVITRQNPDVYVNETLEGLNRQRDHETARRETLAERLAQSLNLSTETIPVDSQGFDIFVRDKIYRGATRRIRKSIRAGLQPNIAETISAMRESLTNLSHIQRNIKAIAKTYSHIDSTKLQGVLKKAETRLSEALQFMSPKSFIQRVELVCGETSEVSLSVKLHLRNGKICVPQQVLSEANLDLLSFLVFLSILQEAAKGGQARFIVLDDVFQSVDSAIRVSLMDYLMAEFSDWQMIFTVHDRLWRNQLRDVFRRHGHEFIEKEIVRWEFDYGPVILEAGKDLERALVDALDRSEILSICAQAGILLEAVCDRLSWTLPISVIRRKEDRYTLSDLWGGVYKVLRKTNIGHEADEVDRWLHLRNLVGAHYNEWATSLSSQEAHFFGEAVLNLYWKIKCSKCFNWIRPGAGSKEGWSCRCGEIAVRLSKADTPP